MLQSIAYLHDADVVHRDVKGDNFLLTKPDITDPDQVIILADFGSAIHLEPHQRVQRSLTRAWL